VLLLALILPLKGAVAAAGVLCHATSTTIALQAAHLSAQHAAQGGAHSLTQHGGHHTAHHSSHHSSHHTAHHTAHPATHHGHAAHAASVPVPGDPYSADAIAPYTPDGPGPYGAAGAAGSAYTACLSCSGICAASPPPVSHALDLATDPVARAQPAPARIAPPSHVAAGLERPPRSL